MNKKNIICTISILLNIFFISYGAKNLYKKHTLKSLQNISVNTPYHMSKQSQFKNLNIKTNDIVFLGDSITDRCEWSELFQNSGIKNRGIDGDTTSEILDRLSTITSGHPKKIFLMIGINDLLHGKNASYVLKNYKKILENIRSNSPNTIIYVQSILPNNKLKSKNDIKTINKNLKKLSNDKNIIYLNLFDSFSDGNGLSKQYTYDGTHLNGKAYLIWKTSIEKYVN